MYLLCIGVCILHQCYLAIRFLDVGAKLYNIILDKDVFNKFKMEISSLLIYFVLSD